MYSALDREVADFDLEYSALEQILGDIKIGADTYRVFSTPDDYSVSDTGRGYTEAFNAKSYLWRVDKEGKLMNPDVSENDQLTMRRVAEETQAAKTIIQMMHKNRVLRKRADADREELQQTMVTRQVKSKKPGAITIPESVLRGQAKDMRDKLAAGSGVFYDVAADVRKKLSGIKREGVQHGTISVQDQVNAMAGSLFNPPAPRRGGVQPELRRIQVRVE